jgi:hypothetical protein
MCFHHHINLNSPDQYLAHISLSLPTINTNLYHVSIAQSPKQTTYIAHMDKEVIPHPRPINGANKIECPSVIEDRAKQLNGQPRDKKVFEGFIIGVGEVESER